MSHAELASPWSPRGLDQFHGMIAAGAFASGDQVVVGMWRDSPLGRFVDVMWVRPDGERVLLAPDPDVAAFIAELYRFDRVRVVGVSGGWNGRHVEVSAGPLLVQLLPGARDWRSWVFAARPRVVRRAPAWLGLEDRLVRPLGGVLIDGAEGVRVRGTTPGGRRESYSIDDYRRVVAGSLLVDGRDAGLLGHLRPDLGVGLSAFPTVPALVNLVTLIEPPGCSATSVGGSFVLSATNHRRPVMVDRPGRGRIDGPCHGPQRARNEGRGS